MSLPFSAFVGYRFFRSRRRSSGAASTLFAVLGVAVGVMTLTAVLGVMNGFQLGFINSILEISSYHLQISLRLPAPPQGAAGLEAELEPLIERLLRLPQLRAVVPFGERQVLLTGPFADQRGCLVRGLPAAAAGADPEFARHLVVEQGVLDLQTPGSLVLGAELARHLGVQAGDTLQVLSLGGESFQDLAPRTELYTVAGLFRSGYYDFDLGWAFAPLGDTLTPGPGGELALSLGVKLHNRFRDQRAMSEVRRALREAGVEQARVSSWREFNRAFFGALRVEKIMMMVLIGLIFVVVGFNISQSLRRSVRERLEEIGVLKALGAGQRAIRDAFILEGLLVGLIGGAAGLAAGLLISANINAVFAGAEAVVNFALALLRAVAAPLAAVPGESFSLFSSAYFYIDQVPSRVLPAEAALILLFALASPTLAAVAATAPVRRVRPAEVLRYE